MLQALLKLFLAKCYFKLLLLIIKWKAIQILREFIKGLNWLFIKPIAG
jgi:hypothetical protein